MARTPHAAPKQARASRTTRQRRTAEEAREAILDATERQLVAGGPDAVRLQQVAAEVGVSHPTVLHHFGSREELIRAAVARALAALQNEVLTAILQTPAGGARVDDEVAVAALLERVARALGDRGHGRAMAWLALSGRASPSEDLGIRAAAEASHRLRRGRRGGRTPPFEDTLFTLLLVFYALFAQSVIGRVVAPSAGLATDARTHERFRKWLAHLVKEHLHAGGP